MKFEKLKTFWNQVTKSYHDIEHYFTQGEFGAKFSPFLTHPCVINTRKFSIKLFSILIIFSGLYYIFGELITILFSDLHLSAYSQRTTIELLLAKDVIIGEHNRAITPLHYTMQSAFFTQSWLFILSYIVCVTYITGNRFRLLGVIFSLLFSIGTSIISTSQGGNYTDFGYLQNLGFELTFFVGNLAMIAIAFGINKHSARKFKYYSIIAGIIGLSCITITIFILTEYTPLLERVSIYSLMIWEIALGFATLREVDTL